MEIKELCFFLLLLSDNTIGSVVEDTSENGVISYDQDSVDLIVNIALSLFDSLQDYTKQINETEDKVKVKFKPKLVIEEIDIESDPTHDNLLFLEQEPEFRKINNAEEDIYDSVNTSYGYIETAESRFWGLRTCQVTTRPDLVRGRASLDFHPNEVWSLNLSDFAPNQKVFKM